MPSRRPTRGEQSGQYPWGARVRLRGTTRWLGWYPTWADANRAEEEFKAELRLCQAEAYRDWLAKVNLAQYREEYPNCPHCGSYDMDRGATGLDLCNKCGGLTRAQREIHA